jgi:hypothetical protein
LIRTLRGHAHWVHGVLLSPDAARALSWSWDHTLAEWDVKTGELMRRYYGPNCFMYAAAWSHDREMVVAGSEEGQLWIWRSSESQPVANFMAHGDSVTALATLPDPARIISAGQDRVIRVWDLDRPGKYRRYFQTIPEARERLARNANDAGALRALGEWYVFRGVYGWGTDLLENARAAGADVSSLVLARCYWQLDRGEEAVREFRRALERREAPADYLNLCIRAVLEPPRTTTQPSTRETFVR